LNDRVAAAPVTQVKGGEEITRHNVTSVDGRLALARVAAASPLQIE
jgi:hypothetical protein